MSSLATQPASDAADLLARAKEAWRLRGKATDEIRRIGKYRNKTAGMRDDLNRWGNLHQQAEKDLDAILGWSAKA
ncbi:hypothetical protein LVB77_14755 [Lysobacter sp. 5GHs7-4]|uniref:hypothetical protein n=1 Tax=Lysobacter sp. 5GHs7-4 TaxID=2904253 RepID=UPI001E5E167E|nr:hypothetical protein [Lysobacter sp. 5GHs7-4]UHQ21926.1 hypothetical protein LVB77_14755 [Lysobacter sp. 5GHs7-4]